jgi:hypothetical protein
MQQLIAWSRLQKLQPTPQPLPAPDAAIPQPDRQDQQEKAPANPQNQQTPTQSLTGKIVKDRSFVLVGVVGTSTVMPRWCDAHRQLER